MRNELDKETSPYLLQHADNPVHWQPWGDAALQRAQAANKPILLSVGYAACHWCHVMAHESFEDPTTAAVMNEHFIPIKVDREERPDIDTIYQSALALLGEQGGWPLTMFLTPDGTPFWGGTYFPPEPRYGRPGFPTLLTRVAEVFKSEPAKVAENATAMREALARMGHASTGDLIPTDIADQVAERLLNEFDSTNGGIGTAPKFPHVPIFELVCRAGLRTANPAMGNAVIFAMRKISQGGIYDHLRGGYARYSTDAQWLAPHFEKMLYDNAQLLTILLTVFNITNDPLFEERIRETCDWVLAEMIAEGGGFAATLDADSEGEEGRFYVWSEDEIDRILGTGKDTATFKKIYDVSATGNWEGKCILNRINNPEMQDSETEARLAAAREKLLTERAKRVRPGWDDKVLADWNGLMITALARAGAAFERPDWIDAATRAFDFIRSRMQIPGTHRLVHTMRTGQQGGPATLDDYAGMINATLTLYEVTGDDGFLETALEWVHTLSEYYADNVNGGFYLTAADAGDLIVRTRNAHDGATPSGNGLMAAAFARLFALTGDDTYRAQAENVIRAFSGEVEKNVFPLATLINAGDLLTRAAQVVIVGRRGETETQAMITAAHRAVAPNLVLQVIAPEASLPTGHPAYGKSQVGNHPTAYVCIGVTCSLPFTDPQDLTHALSSA
jgi:uncharacterized protein YyaL (SSP411 family)